MYTRHAFVETTLGTLTVVAADDSIVGVYFPGHWYLPPAASIGERVERDPLVDEAAVELVEFLAGSRTSFAVPVATSGSALQERVWAILRDIPYGATTTYGAIAEQLGDRALAQSVGQAVGHNPVSIIVPCHRVLGSTGRLTGYAGGVERKRALLDLESPAGVGVLF
jgi:methylated-DNA-[protein]-cysteine S-methyltransferase